MTKLLKLKLFSLSFATLPLLVSCNQTKSLQESPYKDLVQEDYEVNPLIQNFVKDNLFQGDQSKLKSFFNEQLRVEQKFKQEVNMALTFAPLFIPKIEEIAERWKLKTALNSVKIISQTLQQRWFWYLQNLDKFTFVFNNWMPNFKEHRAQYQNQYKKNQLSFEEHYAKEKTLSKSFVGYKIVEFSNEYNLWLNPTNQFFNHKITFLRLKNQENKNILIPFFLYTKTKEALEKEILLTGEIFTFDNDEANWANLYSNLASYIIQGMQYYPNKELEYYNKTKDENEQINQNTILSQFSDQYFLNHYHKNNYSNAFYYANEAFNKNQTTNKMQRYTWGFIDEK